jgi:hypothetical protein
MRKAESVMFPLIFVLFWFSHVLVLARKFVTNGSTYFRFEKSLPCNMIG